MNVSRPRSPRNDQKPMAFTTWEFIRGAIVAWGGFLVLSTIAFAPFMGFYALFALFYTVPWAVGALIVGSPLAYGLGWVLQRSPSMLLHASLFTLLGAWIGVVTTAIALSPAWSTMLGSSGSGLTFPVVAVCASAAIAVPLGWWLTARCALRFDRDELLRTRGRGPDETFEDAVSSSPSKS